MADDAAVLDAPVEVETADTGIDTSTDAPVETPDSSAPEPVETPDPNAPPPVPERIISEDGKKLSEQAKATLEEMRKTNPQMAKQFRDALFEADRFKRAVPGGLREVQQLREAFEQLGGDEGIRQTREELTGWQQFDQQFTAGDPRALDFMLEDDAGKESFLKLAPVAFQRFSELNPDGYGAYIAKAFVATMDSWKIPLALERLQDFIGENPKAQQTFQQIAEFVGKLNEFAAKPVNAPKAAPAPGTPDPRMKDLETRESNLTRDEWRRETAGEQNKVYVSELTRALAGRKVSDVQREDILHRVQTKLGLRIKEQEGKLGQYFAVRDKEGFLKFTKAFTAKEIPALVQEAVDRYVSAKPGPKAQPAPGNNGAAPPKPVPGFTTVSKMPGSNDIDWSHPFNNQSNIKQGQAVLKNGQKVTWKR